MLKNFPHVISRWGANRKILSSLSRYGSTNSHSKEFYEYWQTCKRDAPVLNNPTLALDKLIRSFTDHGVTSWSTEKSNNIAETVYRRLLVEEKADPECWDNSFRYKEDVLQAFPEIENIFHDSLSDFLCCVYGTHYKIFYGRLYKSVGRDVPAAGSAMWHRDGGPGTCINVMFGISPLSKSNDALTCISQKHTLQLTKEALSNLGNSKRKKIQAYGDDTKKESRLAISDYVEKTISLKRKYKVFQPTGDCGLIIPFRNNNFHRGGNPSSGETRYVCIFHVYPAEKAPDWVRYRQIGVRKTGSFPESPSGEILSS